MGKKSLLLFVIFLSAVLFACQNSETTTTTIATTSSTFATSDTTAITTEAVTTDLSTTPTTTAEQTMSERVNSLANEYKIGLFITEEPTTSIGINFAMPSDTYGYVEYSIAGENNFTRYRAISKARAIGSKYAYLFEVTLSNLTPGETYDYRVTNTDDSEASPYYQFTMPSNDSDAFTFIYLADPQENSEIGYMAYAYSLLSVMEYSEQTYDFVMFPGDLVDDADLKTEWALFYKYSSIFSYNTPIVATVGNHDVGAISDERIQELEFDGYLNLPNNGPEYNSFNMLEGDLRSTNFDDGKTYSFDYGYAHFIVIDTEIYCDGTTACLAYDTANADILNDWIADDLRNNALPWTIVLLHRGPYSLSYNTSSVRDNLVPIFDEYGVDLVLSGHDHQYSRAVYSEDTLLEFATSNTYTKGDIFLSDTTLDDYDFNQYDRAIGVTYLTGNTASTKFYGGDKASGLSVNYKFIDEQPVIPYITVTENSISVVSYVVLKDTAFAIIPNGVDILEEFSIIKD